MVVEKIPLFKIYWDREDLKLVTESIRQGMFWAIGPNIERFERRVAEHTGKKYALAFNSGTSALHALLIAHGVKQGDEIIVPSFAFIATANSGLFVGARPVFADIEEETLGLDPIDVEKKITKRTRVIMPIHYGGSPCRIKELMEVTEDHKLILIEDTAESMGARVHGRVVGSFGDSAMFSFAANKIVTTGEGGMIITDSPDIYKKLKLLRSHGRLETENYFTSTKSMDYVSLGYNWRMSNITAALGLSQFSKLDKLIKMRRKNAKYLTRKLSKIVGVTPPSPPEGYFHVFQMYTIRVKEGQEIRNDLKNYLAERGIGTKVYFSPVHLTSFYRNKFGYRGGELPVTEKVSQLVLTLPMYPAITSEELDYIAECTEIFMRLRHSNS